MSQDIQDSPIITSGPPVAIGSDELRKLVKDVAYEVAEEQKTEMLDSLNRYFLNLQLYITKQFVNQETTFAKLLKSQVNQNNLQAQIEHLREENEFLKKKINELWKK